MKERFALVKCPKCNIEVRDNLLNKHLFEEHGISKIQPEKNSGQENDTQSSQASTWATDDSGVLIPLEQYAKLKGNNDGSDRRNKRLGDVSLHTKTDPEENIFVEIANMSSPAPTKRQLERQRKRWIKENGRGYFECPYCDQEIIGRNRFKHIKKVHPDKYSPTTHSRKPTKQQRIKSKPKEKATNSDKAHLVPEGQEGNFAIALREAYKKKHNKKNDN